MVGDNTTMVEEGYILSNKYRIMIFDELNAGETNINYIAKKHRIVPRIALKVITDFQEKGIVKQKGNHYVFTPEGKKLAETIG